MNQLTKPDTFQILAVSKGHTVNTGNEVARIQANFSLLDREGKPKKQTAKIISEIKEFIL